MSRLLWFFQTDPGNFSCRYLKYCCLIKWVKWRISSLRVLSISTDSIHALVSQEITADLTCMAYVATWERTTIRFEQRVLAWGLIADVSSLYVLLGGDLLSKMSWWLADLTKLRVTIRHWCFTNIIWRKKAALNTISSSTTFRKLFQSCVHVKVWQVILTVRFRGWLSLNRAQGADFEHIRRVWDLCTDEVLLISLSSQANFVSDFSHAFRLSASEILQITIDSLLVNVNLLLWLHIRIVINIDLLINWNGKRHGMLHESWL